MVSRQGFADRAGLCLLFKWYGGVIGHGGSNLIKRFERNVQIPAGRNIQNEPVQTRNA